VLDRIEQITAVKPSFYSIDVSDKEKLCALFETEGSIDAIIHFAAFKAVGRIRS
jgi:UDP-glucose 4-epimerase